MRPRCVVLLAGTSSVRLDVKDDILQAVIAQKSSRWVRGVSHATKGWLARAPRVLELARASGR